MVSSLTFGLSFLIAAAVQGAPAPALQARQSITALSTSQIESFKPFTFYASTGYCNPSVTRTWSCGANCEANPAFQPVAVGGDGDDVPFWFVGYDPRLDTVIVSHEGTNTSEILPFLTDANIVRSSLDSKLFPGVSHDVTAHDGFLRAQAASAADVLSAVQSAMSQFNTKQVTITGHSLGAAISLLDAIYLPLHISDATFTYIGYGLPRVGNQDFANYVDAQNILVTHINNEEDPIPTLPPMLFGYHHPSGEIHIEDSGEWASCPGQDNPSTQCEVGDVSNIFVADESDHDGPYDGVEMGC